MIFQSKFNPKKSCCSAPKVCMSPIPCSVCVVCRLGIHIPELTTMQVRAIFEAACIVAKEGVDVHPEVMIPLTSHVNELKVQRGALEAEAKKVMQEQDIKLTTNSGP